MFKTSLLSVLFIINTLFSQSLIQKNVYKAEKPGAIAEINVIKNFQDNHIYIVAREAINGKLILSVYDNSLNRITKIPATASLDISNSFIKNGNLYFLDDRIKYLALSDFKAFDVNDDRRGISFFSLEKTKGKDVMLACDMKSWFLYDLNTHKEILNIKRESNSSNRATGTIFDSAIYYTSESNEISRFDINGNKVSWSVKLPDKPVKIIGIKLSSVPAIITSIMAFNKRGKEYIGVTTINGDYYSFDAKSGKLVKDDIQYEKFDDISQNNSKLFVNSYIHRDNQTDRMLIYAASIDKNVYCLNENDFSTIWETSTGNEIYSPLTLLDINNDTYPEIFGVNDYDENLFILDGKTGKKIVFTSIKEGKQFNRTRVHLADLYGTGSLNLIVKINKEKIKIYELPQVQVPKNFISSVN